MNSELWQKVKKLFDEANQTSGKARATFLKKLRERDEILSQEIESLLSASHDSQEFMEFPAEMLLDKSSHQGKGDTPWSRLTSSLRALSPRTRIALLAAVGVTLVVLGLAMLR